MTTPTRQLGSSGIEVSALGMGCWAIGGPWTLGDNVAGWSEVDDAESLRAIHRAIDLGVTMFDTAANYGAGHSERLIGRAIAGRRDDVVIATKFGYQVDEENRSVMPYDGSDEDSDVASRLRRDVEASLTRLGTDHIDVYLLHVWGLAIERALDAREILEELVAEGKIRTYGWSTDREDAVQAFSTSPQCGVVEQALSVLENPAPGMLDICEELDLASLNRGPLGMGLLTGKFSATTTFPSDDHRRFTTWHPGFRDGQPTKEWLDQLAAIRDVLTSDGRTLAQGALAWIWAHSQRTVPIPGFRTVEQVEDNCGALAHGPLTAAQMDEIAQILSRSQSAGES
jgi:aryl-alcohol dehydrogenase-like predicted oxidoreductase